MAERRRAWISWSSGKDSAFALHAALADDTLDVVGLLTTFNDAADRVAMHAVRRDLVEQQAQRLGLPLHAVGLPYPCPNGEYERRMAVAMDAATGAGVQCVVFGDLHLADVRAYREQALESTGIAPLFPLWQEPTDDLAQRMLATGLQAVLTCVDPAQVPADLVGRPFDQRLLDALPATADPCGENGEFHTFVWSSPDFSGPIPVRVGEVVERDGFVFCDVVANHAAVRRPAAADDHRGLRRPGI